MQNIDAWCTMMTISFLATEIVSHDWCRCANNFLTMQSKHDDVLLMTKYQMHDCTLSDDMWRSNEVGDTFIKIWFFVFIFILIFICHGLIFTLKVKQKRLSENKLCFILPAQCSCSFGCTSMYIQWTHALRMRSIVSAQKQMSDTHAHEHALPLFQIGFNNSHSAIV